MRILIDCTHTATYPFKNTGIHRVVRQVTSELLKIGVSQSHEVILVKFNGQSIIKVETLQEKTNQTRLGLWKTIRNKFFIYFNKSKNKISRLLPIFLFKAKTKKIKKFLEVSFSSNDIYVIADANWDLPISYQIFLKNLKSLGVSINILCYDLIPIKFPEYCSQKFVKDFRNFYFQNFHSFDKVICISQKSAEDYQEILGSGQRSDQLITHFRLGCDYVKASNNCTLEFIRPELNDVLKYQYILVVGSLVPHKNIKTIISAFDLLLKQTYSKPYLVFAGNKGWHSETDNLIESHPKYAELIHIFHSVSDQELDLLYKNCYLLVQASLYEGYGLPVVEALQHHKPVICSNAGSLPEVGGEFCVYFDPYQPNELYQALVSLLTSPDKYNEIASYIKENYKPTTWEESAQQLLNILLT